MYKEKLIVYFMCQILNLVNIFVTITFCSKILCWFCLTGFHDVLWNYIHSSVYITGYFLSRFLPPPSPPNYYHRPPPLIYIFLKFPPRSSYSTPSPPPPTTIWYPGAAEGSTSNKYYVQIEDIFNVIHGAHVSIGHGGRNRMVKETGAKYKNITAECIMLYLN